VRNKIIHFNSQLAHPPMESAKLASAHRRSMLSQMSTASSASSTTTTAGVRSMNAMWKKWKIIDRVNIFGDSQKKTNFTILILNNIITLFFAGHECFIGFATNAHTQNRQSTGSCNRNWHQINEV